MKKTNKLIVGLMVMFLLLVVCGAKDSPKGQEVYYNQQKDGFYVRIKGTDKTGTRFAPYLGEPNNKQRIKKLENQYTQMVQEINKEQTRKAVNKGKKFSLTIGIIFLVGAGLIIRWLVKKFNK